MNDRKVGSIYAVVDGEIAETAKITGMMAFDDRRDLAIEWSEEKGVTLLLPEPGKASYVKFFLLMLSGADIHDLGPDSIFLVDRATFDTMHNKLHPALHEETAG